MPCRLHEPAPSEGVLAIRETCLGDGYCDTGADGGYTRDIMATAGQPGAVAATSSLLAFGHPAQAPRQIVTAFVRLFARLACVEVSVEKSGTPSTVAVASRMRSMVRLANRVFPSA